MEIAKPALERTKIAYHGQPYHVQQRACEQGSILESLDNLLTYPWIKSGLEEGNLTLTGWYFNFEDGELLSYHAESGKFIKISPDISNEN